MHSPARNGAQAISRWSLARMWGGQRSTGQPSALLVAIKGYIFFQPGHWNDNRDEEKRRDKYSACGFVPGHCGSFGYVFQPAGAEQ
jgi:hypothetical protein